MEFYKNGTKVEILDSNIIGTVIGVCIRGLDNVTIEYHVQWMVGGSIQDQWLYDYNVKRHIDTKKQAGLVNYETGLTKPD